MYVRSSDLGINPAVVPVAVAVYKNLNIFKNLFGGKLVYGVKKEEFKQRHNSARWFRALWIDYFVNGPGASEIPPGMTLNDYYVKRFGGPPFFVCHGQRVPPASTLRLTAIHPEMGTASNETPEQIFAKAARDCPPARVLAVLPEGYNYDFVNKKIIPPTLAPATTALTTTAGFGSLFLPIAIGVGVLLLTRR